MAPVLDTRPSVVIGVLVVALCGAACGLRLVARRADHVGAARTFRLAQFTPATFEPGKPQQISFTIEQPSGAPLTSYRTGPGPHTGVHLIIVRSDLGAIVHKHPPIGADGRITEEITLPTPGRYRVVIDAYPKRAALCGTFSSSARSPSPAKRRRSPCRRSAQRSPSMVTASC